MANIEVETHRKFNPKLFDGDEMKPEVRKQLSAIVNAFLDYCNQPVKVKDVWLVGSSANYTWNSKSDIDIQVIADLGSGKDKDLLVSFFDTKKKVFKRDHPISIYGMPVEVTVSGDDTVAGGEGCYSLRDDKWVTEPEHKAADYDEDAAGALATKWRKQILDVVRDKESTPDAMGKLKSKIKKARSKALVDNNGDDFHPVNLAYKHIRSRGYIDLLKREMRKRLTKKLSLHGDH